MLKLIIPLLNLFALFILGVVISFPIALMCDAIALLFSWLPILWAIAWRSGLGLMTLTAIALFLKAIKD